MNRSCEPVLELLADLAAERLPPDAARAARAHLEACPSCREIHEAARWVYVSRPQAPPELPAGVIGAVRSARPHVRTARPLWRWAAAAAVVLAVGLTWTMERRGGPGNDGDAAPEYAYDLEHEEMWIADDGIIAGAPTLDELSDETLLQLLDELSPNSAGGAA